MINKYKKVVLPAIFNSRPMSKLSKLVNNPKLFFIDYARKRMPKYKHLYIQKKPQVEKQITHQTRETKQALTNYGLPDWFRPTMGVELKAALNSSKPVYLYIPWIGNHGNALIEQISVSDKYMIAELDIFKDIDKHETRKAVIKFAKENPHIYRRMLASRLIGLRERIKGIIFTFDWAPVMRVCANLCEELKIARILIPHESVFADREKYYLDTTTGANTPVADLVLGWGELQKKMFTERGYPEKRFITVGAPKFDAYFNHQPQLDKECFASLFGLDAEKKTILFATQPLDYQFDENAARIAQRQAINDVIDYCVARDMQMILRLPPSKDNILNMALTRRISSLDNISIDDSLCYLVSPEEAIHHSDLVVSINSTMLFEAMLMGKPSISMKYLEFEQIWQRANIPAVEDKTGFYDIADSLLNSKWQPDADGMNWAAQQFSNGCFDGLAAKRISDILQDIASGKYKIDLRNNAAQRVLFDRDDDHVSIIGTHSEKNAALNSQLYLLAMLNGSKRVQAQNGLKDVRALSASDLFLQWGVTNTNNKSRQNHLRRNIGRPLLYVEDGFIRSIDIGLSGTPGLSVILDDRTAYYDATKLSRLQMLLEDRPELTISEKLRAEKAISKIIEGRISKYNHAPDIRLNIGEPQRKKLLLVDQRYGDQSVISGIAGEDSFRQMLADAVDGYYDHDIIIKRHPDAIKGGKAGYFSNDNISHLLAMDNVHLVDKDVNPYALLDIVDEVFVATSGMGFEALMAGKKVHCYGIPFYAGWGETIDRKINIQRSRKRSVTEIFHFAYIVLSRYYSPSLGRRCEIEELVEHIISMKQAAHHESSEAI